MARKKTPAYVTEQKIFPTRLEQLMKTEPRTSHEELGNAIGVTRQAVGHYVRGQSSPSWEVLNSIADYFSVSTDYLLGRTDIKKADFGLAYIQKYTGLSEIAVDRLNYLHNHKEYSLAVEILNSLYLSTIDGDISSWETVVDYTRKAANAFNGQFPSPYKDEYINPHDLAHYFIRAAADTVTHELQKTITDLAKSENVRMKAEEDNG